MTANKKFLIISLVASLLYIVLGLVFMLVNKANVVSIVLFAAIVAVSVVSCVLTWKIMRDQNRGKME